MHNSQKQHRTVLLSSTFLLVAALALSAGAGQMRFPVSQSGQESLAAQNINVIRIDADNIAQYRPPHFRANANGASPPLADPSPYKYRMGPGDELRIQVWADPEHTQLASSAGGTTERGLLVNEQGLIFYPFVGSLRVSGRSAAEVCVDLADQLRNFISNPQVEVSIISLNAHQATVTGAVGMPGPVQITNFPKHLLDEINSAGISEQVDLMHVTVRRRGTAHSVKQNSIILPGDMINMPPLRDNKIFTFGEITTTEIPLNSDLPCSLTEVLANVGAIDRVRSDSRGILVFRRTPQTPDGFDVYQFDITSAAVLDLATDFQMAPLDIIFVTNDPITRWNDTVGTLVSPLGGLRVLRRTVEEL